MKKIRFLALTSLCSVFAGMPANAQEIKDSGAKKIGGVETQVSKESPNGKNKNEFKNRFDAEYIKKLLKDPYVEWVLGVLTIGGTHEGLSYFKGKLGQFYKIPARFSLTGYFRKRKALKALEEAEKIYETRGVIGKIETLDSQRLFDGQIFNQEKFDSLGSPGDCVTQPEKLSDEKLQVAILANTNLTQEEYNKVKERFDFYICYFKQNLKGIKLVYCLKGREEELFSAASKVNSIQTMAEFDSKFTLLSAVKM